METFLNGTVTDCVPVLTSASTVRSEVSDVDALSFIFSSYSPFRKQNRVSLRSRHETYCRLNDEDSFLLGSF